jgi:hypothetical protein
LKLEGVVRNPVRNSSFKSSRFPDESPSSFSNDLAKTREDMDSLEQAADASLQLAADALPKPRYACARDDIAPYLQP